MAMDVEFRRIILGKYMDSTLHYCLQCSRCNDVCPVNEVSDGAYNPRSVILSSYLGLKSNLLGTPKNIAVWGCQVCDTCDLICPQDIELTEIFYIVKNLSVQAGEAPEYYIVQAKTVMENGKAIPLQPAIDRRRKSMGLPDVPTGFESDVKTILKETKLEEKLSKY
ncbi:MAG: 4Fe-4S dicluster domain-containing protein [Candidatus Helarchaeota archaeon]